MEFESLLFRLLEPLLWHKYSGLRLLVAAALGWVATRRGHYRQ
jgi:hypothetical protein